MAANFDPAVYSRNAEALFLSSVAGPHCHLKVEKDNRVTQIFLASKKKGSYQPSRSLKSRVSVIYSAFKEIAMICKTYDECKPVIVKLVAEGIFKSENEGVERFLEARLDAEEVSKEFKELVSSEMSNEDLNARIKDMVSQGRLPSMQVGWSLVIKARLPMTMQLLSTINLEKMSQKDAEQFCQELFEAREIQDVALGIVLIRHIKKRKDYEANPTIEKLKALIKEADFNLILLADDPFWKEATKSLTEIDAPPEDIIAVIDLLSKEDLIDKHEAVDRLVDIHSKKLGFHGEISREITSATRMIHQFFRPGSRADGSDSSSVSEDSGFSGFSPASFSNESSSAAEASTAGFPSPTPSEDSLAVETVLGGTSGVYFIHDETSQETNKVRLAVFKPRDETPFCENNPLGLKLNPEFPMDHYTCGYTLGEDLYRERGSFVAAKYLLGWDVIPETHIVKVPFRKKPAPLDTRRQWEVTESDLEIVTKEGSLQKFVKGVVIDENPQILMRVPHADMQRASLLQILFDAGDGNTGNFLVSVPDGTEHLTPGDPRFQEDGKIVCIDNGRCLGPQMFERSANYVNEIHVNQNSILIDLHAGPGAFQAYGIDRPFENFGIRSKVLDEVAVEFKEMQGLSEFQARCMLRAQGLSHDAISAFMMRHKMISKGIDVGHSPYLIGEMLRLNVEGFFREARELIGDHPNFAQKCEDYILEQWTRLVEGDRPRRKFTVF